MGPLSDFTPYTKTKAVLNLWAGVETIVGNATLTQPLVRMIDHGLTQGMVEWVSAHSLRYHVGMDAHIHGQDGTWRNTSWPPLAETRRVTVPWHGGVGNGLCPSFTINWLSRHRLEPYTKNDRWYKLSFR
jgi:glyoxylate/hydroxypyruvate reductase A